MTAKTREIESLIKAGMIGAGLGAILLGKRKGKDAAIVGLALAAISASLDAKKRRKNSKLSITVKEKNAIYRIDPDGKKVLIKVLQKHSVKLEPRFKLK